MNNKKLEQVRAIKLLGLYITEEVPWQLNCEEMCKKAYSRISLLSRLKYVGVSRKDLIEVYKLFIRSTLEYCSVVYHSRLTEEQSRMLDHAQAVCLRVILDSDYEQRY